MEKNNKLILDVVGETIKAVKEDLEGKIEIVDNRNSQSDMARIKALAISKSINEYVGNQATLKSKVTTSKSELSKHWKSL